MKAIQILIVFNKNTGIVTGIQRII
jgi:hypothetical protein